MTPEPAPDRLRDAFAASTDLSAGGCPAAEALWMAVARELPAAQIHPIVLHTAQCELCADVWRLAHRTMVSEGLSRPVAPAPMAAWRSIWVIGPGLAAAALLVIGVLVDRPFDTGQPVSSTTLRTATDASIEPLLDDGSVVDRASVELRWSPQRDGTRYDVTVSTEDLTVVSRGTSLAEARYVVPSSDVSHLPAGTKLFWQVSATGSDQVRTVSPTFMIQLR